MKISVGVQAVLIRNISQGIHRRQPRECRNGQRPSYRPIFLCSIKPGSSDDISNSPSNPDPDQIGVEWIPICELANIRF
jgi:hypothetical protein